MNNKRANPLVLWRVDAQEWAFWPDGRLRYYGFQHDLNRMRNLLYADYGRQAVFWVYRAMLGPDGKVQELIFIEAIPAVCTDTRAIIYS